MELCDFMIVQQKDGFGEFLFTYRAPEWIKNPVSDTEKRYSSIFSSIDFKLELEQTGANIILKTEVTPIGGNDFNVKLTAPAGGPYTLYSKFIFIDADGKESTFGWTAFRAHIGVGDVFLIAGQSNASGTGRGLIFEGAELGISTCKRNGKWDIATHPLSGEADKHSPFLTFAKTLFRECGYPIGLIPRAYGGTWVDQWSAGGNFIEPLKAEISRENIKVKAIIWYQGENEADRNKVDGYFENMVSAFTEMRNALGGPEIPIFIFQLNCLLHGGSDEGFSAIREIQRTAPEKISNTYVIPTIDAHIMSDWIHNSRASNIMLGERLAYLALDCLYNKRHTPKAPNIKEAYKTADDIIMLEFDNVEGELCAFLVCTDDLPVTVTDDDGEIRKTAYKIDRNKITVSLERKIGENATVGAINGRNPKYIIIDLETQMPVLPFYNVKIKN